MAKWQVFLECPHKPLGKRWRIAEPLLPPRHEKVKVFSIIVDAKSKEEAEKRLVGRTVECPFPVKGKFHKFTVKPENIVKVQAYPPPPPPLKERETKIISYKPPAHIKAPTQLASAKRFPDNTIAISIRAGAEQLNILYAQPQVTTFDKLWKTAKAAGHDTLENAILAYMLATTAGTATQVTGFLTATGIKTDRTSVGEAMSRMVGDGLLYKYRHEILFVRKPLPPFGKGVRRWTTEIMGEPVYGIPHTVRINILEKLKFDPAFPWWRRELYRLAPVRKKPEYEWVKTVKPLPKIRSAEDLKWYGPHEPGETVKLPTALAYFLTHQGYAEWLNPAKETVKQAEEIFKFQPIEKIKRQATLTEF